MRRPENFGEQLFILEPTYVKIPLDEQNPGKDSIQPVFPLSRYLSSVSMQAMKASKDVISRDSTGISEVLSLMAGGRGVK